MKNIIPGLAILVILFSSCQKEKVYGCTDPRASNYSETANKDNGTCQYLGNATFWYNSSGTDATVYLNGQVAKITQFYPVGLATCGSPGCATFNLTEGTYTYHAESTWSTWDGTVVITSKGCTMTLLN